MPITIKVQPNKGDPPKPVRLRGRIISDRNGTQAIMTESKEEGKRIIHCMGFTRIENATTGDWVILTYTVLKRDGIVASGVWRGRRVEA